MYNIISIYVYILKMYRMVIIVNRTILCIWKLMGEKHFFIDISLFFKKRGICSSLYLKVSFSSVQSLSPVRLFVTPWITARQASLSITNSQSSPRLTSIESAMPSSHVILCRPLLLLPPIPPSISLCQWVNSSHEVAKVLEFQLQHHSLQRNPRADLLQNGLVGSPCSPRDSQESSPTPQFKRINSSAHSLLHSPTLTSVHDHWKNHSLD